MSRAPRSFCASLRSPEKSEKIALMFCRAAKVLDSPWLYASIKPVMTSAPQKSGTNPKNGNALVFSDFQPAVSDYLC